MRAIVLLVVLGCAVQAPSVDVLGVWQVRLTGEPVRGRLLIGDVNGCSLCGVYELGDGHGYVLNAVTGPGAVAFDLDDGRHVRRATAVLNTDGMVGTIEAAGFRATLVRGGGGQEPN